MEPTELGQLGDPRDAVLDQMEPLEEKPLLGVLALYPIFDTLCSHLDISGLITLRKISKKLGTHLSTHMKERWNINRRLGRFVRDPCKFRSAIAHHDALVSGSFAIQFFDDVLFNGSDLDAYIQDGEGASAFGHYLRRGEGYALEKEEIEHAYSLDEIVKTETYKRWKGHGEMTKIQIVSTRSTPVQAILHGFYTTAVVNFLSWNKAYSIFPDITFLHPRTTYPLKRIDRSYPPLLAKYEIRGWTMSDPIPEESLYSICVNTSRHVRDYKTRKIALNTTGVGPPRVPDFVLESSCFQLRSSQENYRYLSYKVDAWPYES